MVRWATYQHIGNGFIVFVLGAICVQIANASNLDVEALTEIIRDQEQQIRSVMLTWERHERDFRPVPSMPERVLNIDPDLPARLDVNRMQRVREQLWFELATGRWKTEREDLRDVDRLAREIGLPESRLGLVSLTGSKIVGEKNYFVTFKPGPPNAILAIMPIPENAIREPSLHSGLIRFQALSRASLVTISEGQGECSSLTKVVVKWTSREATYYVDPQKGYRFQKAEYHDTEGKLLREKINLDFRLVDGVWYPFQQKERQWNTKGKLTREKVITIEEARFNIELAKEHFEINVPAGTSVTDTVGRRAVFNT